MGLDLDVFFVYPLRCRMPIRTVLSPNKKDRDCGWVWGEISWGEGPEHGCQVRLMLVAREGCRWVLARVNTPSGWALPTQLRVL